MSTRTGASSITGDGPDDAGYAATSAHLRAGRLSRAYEGMASLGRCGRARLAREVDAEERTAVDVLTIAVARRRRQRGTCAGDAFAGGEDLSFQTGVGFGDVLKAPAVVPLPFAVEAVALGTRHSLFLVAGGRVFAAGDGAHGRLGCGAGSAEIATTPVEVAGLKSAVAIAAGTLGSAALTKSGELYTWGSGALGHPVEASGGGGREFTTLWEPRRVQGVTVAQCCLSSSAIAIVSVAGEVLTQGWNTTGALGYETGPASGDRQLSLRKIPGLVVKQIALSDAGAVAVPESDEAHFVFEWGFSAARALRRVAVPECPSSVAISCLASVVCGGSVYSWRPGVGVRVAARLPSRHRFKFLSGSADGGGTLLIEEHGDVYLWDDRAPEALPARVFELKGARSGVVAVNSFLVATEVCRVEHAEAHGASIGALPSLRQLSEAALTASLPLEVHNLGWLLELSRSLTLAELERAVGELAAAEIDVLFLQLTFEAQRYDPEDVEPLLALVEGCAELAALRAKSPAAAEPTPVAIANGAQHRKPRRRRKPKGQQAKSAPSPRQMPRPAARSATSDKWEQQRSPVWGGSARSPSSLPAEQPVTPPSKTGFAVDFASLVSTPKSSPSPPRTWGSPSPSSASAGSPSFAQLQAAETERQAKMRPAARAADTRWDCTHEVGADSMAAIQKLEANRRELELIYGQQVVADLPDELLFALDS